LLHLDGQVEDSFARTVISGEILNIYFTHWNSSLMEIIEWQLQCQRKRKSGVL